MPDGTSLLIPFILAPHSSEFSTTFEFCPMVICFFQTKYSRLEGIFVVMLLLLLLSHFSRVRLCATPQTAAHQAPLSLGGKNTGVGCHFPLHCSDEAGNNTSPTQSLRDVPRFSQPVVPAASFLFTPSEMFQSVWTSHRCSCYYLFQIFDSFYFLQFIQD